MNGTIFLKQKNFKEEVFTILKWGEFYAQSFRYPSGVEALKLGNTRGHITILPYMGQMIWDVFFDNFDLKMKNMFTFPHKASTILGTYGCFFYHSGMLRNGCPSEIDTHALHGEMPCAPMDRAEIIFGQDTQGHFLGIKGAYEYVEGFGSHYMASPSVKIYSGSALFNVSMHIENLGNTEMDLMYMSHMNPFFERGCEIIQPMEYTKENCVVRRSIPAHLNPTQAWLNFLNEVENDPSKMAILDQEDKYNPEIVFFLKNPEADSEGYAHFLMKRKNGCSCYCAYDTKVFDHLARWVLCNEDQKVMAFALPATCDPEGYTKEREKGNVKKLQPKETRTFHLRAGYLNAAESKRFERLIHR